MEIRGLTEKEKLLLYGVTESEADEFLLLDFPRYYNKIYYSVLISVSLFIILAGIFGIIVGAMFFNNFFVAIVLGVLFSLSSILLNYSFDIITKCFPRFDLFVSLKTVSRAFDKLVEANQEAYENVKNKFLKKRAKISEWDGILGIQKLSLSKKLFNRWISGAPFEVLSAFAT